MFNRGFSAMVLIGAVTAHAQELSIVDSEAVRQARLEQNQAMAIGDVEHAASFWTDDVTLRRGLGSATTGKDAYLALLDPNPSENSVIYERVPESIEVSPHWPLAFESGSWIARRGETVLISGRYSAQWVKREGKWLIRSEVFVALTCSENVSNWPATP